MTDLDPFQLPTGVYVAIAVVFGLVIGSFINVVVVRLPRMMEAEWRRQCEELLSGTPAAAPEHRFDLAAPASHCPRCGHRLRLHENIPLLSYLLLRGRCSACGGPIAFRYPVLEAAAGLLAGLTVWALGPGVEALATLGLTWTLLALTAIDLEHQLLPDSLTLPLLWSGLVLNAFGVITDLHSSVWGAVAGYGTLWVVYWLFKLTTGKEGMGYGDFKLLAAIGAWLGWQALPLVVILSSVVGAAVGLSLIALRRLHRGVPIPFGPFLAAAGWIALLWGPALTGAYWQALGIR